MEWKFWEQDNPFLGVILTPNLTPNLGSLTTPEKEFFLLPVWS